MWIPKILSLVKRKISRKRINPSSDSRNALISSFGYRSLIAEVRMKRIQETFLNRA